MSRKQAEIIASTLEGDRERTDTALTELKVGVAALDVKIGALTREVRTLRWTIATALGAMAGFLACVEYLRALS